MLANIFQLAGALMTLYSIISMSTREVQSSHWVVLPILNKKDSGILHKLAYRNYAYAGAIYIIVGYVIPTLQLDIAVINQRLAAGLVLCVSVCALVAFGVFCSRHLAKRTWDKMDIRNPDGTIIPHGAIALDEED